MGILPDLNQQFHAPRPELVFGLAAPVGVDLDAVSDSINQALRSVGYNGVNIKLTEEMTRLAVEADPPASAAYHHQIMAKMDYATKLCKKHAGPKTMALVAVRAIQFARAKRTTDITRPASDTAYIIRQLKRPDEVTTLRRIYGKQFILVSAYSPTEDRFSSILEKIKNSSSSLKKNSELKFDVHTLLERDESEENTNGQHIRDTFHLADVFVDASTRQTCDASIDRFLQAFFGKTDVTPTKDEYGMFAAKSASLRSADLSRQVGAAIFSEDGEVITQGCNEVPKAFGGTYWDSETPDYRDVKLGHDPNELLKRQMLKDLLERMNRASLLSEHCTSLGGVEDMIRSLTGKTKNLESGETTLGPLAEASIMDVTEYGRIVHAEMSAICDAARVGRAVKRSILYCTTFPCHNCTKHIVSSGISRVVYIEPYPKSRAVELHGHEVSLEQDDSNKVSFVPFIGISPFRYRDIFQKGRRKERDGTAKTWLLDRPMPMVDIGLPTYVDVESGELASMIGVFEPVGEPHAVTQPRTDQTSA